MLKSKKSYILDMRTAQDPPPPPPLETPRAAAARRQAGLSRMLERYVAQPPLDFFHHQLRAEKPVLRAGRDAAETTPEINVPVIF